MAPLTINLTGLVMHFFLRVTYFRKEYSTLSAIGNTLIADDRRMGAVLVAFALVLVPGIALVLTTLAFNFMGDGLRDAFDPRMRGKN